MAQLTLQQAYDLAFQHHSAGQLREAEQIYRQILALFPRHAESLHHLGILAQQVGRYEEAVELIRQSIDVKADVPEAHNNLSVVLRKTGKFTGAINAARRAITLWPDYSDAHYNLGLALKDDGDRDAAIEAYHRAISLKPNYVDACNNLGIALGEKGQLDDAIALYRKAISINPAYLMAYNNLAVALHEQKKFDESLAVLQELISKNPEYANAHNSLGNLQKDLGQLDEAIASYQRAISLRPGYADAHANLGRALRDAGQPEAAVPVYLQAIALEPNDAERYHDLGDVLREVGQLDQAISSYRQALVIRPDYAEVMSNLSVALRESGQLDESVEFGQKAVDLRPDDAIAIGNLGLALQEKGAVDAAVALFRRALESNPNQVEVYNNLAFALSSQGLVDESIANYRKAVSLKPDDARVRSGLLFALHYNPACDARSLADEHRQWDQHHAAPLRHLIRPHSNDRDPDRRLRIGYLSPDFKSHVLSRSLAPLLSRHDHSQFEIFCYAHVHRGDAVTQWLKQYADHWCNIARLTDEQTAAKIREDQIDLLVDLSLHSSDNRLTVFARKPAPVQLTYLGYCSTTGLSAIDYRISDPYLDPPGTDLSLYSEKTIHLKKSYWCYNPAAESPVPAAVPQISSGYVTFGCLNNFAKVSQDARDLWAAILLQVPGSRLLLHSYPGSHREHAIDRFAALGIDADRIEFVGFQPIEDYLKTFNRIDVGLDPFPYAGGITSCDSLWMRVPFVTLAGKQSPVSRGGCSILGNVGLGDLVAHDDDAYVSKAVQLAGDLPRLVELRSTLKTRMKQSPLMDVENYARNVESIYWQIWREWCSNPHNAG